MYKLNAHIQYNICTYNNLPTIIDFIYMCDVGIYTLNIKIIYIKTFS